MSDPGRPLPIVVELPLAVLATVFLVYSIYWLIAFYDFSFMDLITLLFAAASLVFLVGRRRWVRRTMLVFGILFGVLLVRIDNKPSEPRHSWEASALSAGRSAKLAEALYYQEHAADNYSYTSLLSHLLVHDRNLTDDRGVTFLWSYAGHTNFTFTTSHVKGVKTFLYYQ